MNSIELTIRLCPFFHTGNMLKTKATKEVVNIINEKVEGILTRDIKRMKRGQIQLLISEKIKHERSN